MSEREKLDRIILVYDADSGIAALVHDIVKKALGREDCALCEITYGPLGKRSAWRQCAATLDIIVDELHRDRVPEAWGLPRAELPCILARHGDSLPAVLISKAEIELCRGSALALEARIRAALQVVGAAGAGQRRTVSA